MTNKDPNLIKTPIADDKVVDDRVVDDKVKVVEKDVADKEVVRNDAIVKEPKGKEYQDSEHVEEETLVHKGTETLESDVYDSEHVKDGDNPARQPDRRDQQGQTPFDGGINEDTAQLTEQPKSEEISERNRYATIDNAQTRVLPEDDIRPAD